MEVGRGTERVACHCLMPQCLTLLPNASPPDGTASIFSQQEISVGSIYLASRLIIGVCFVVRPDGTTTYVIVYVYQA